MTKSRFHYPLLYAKGLAMGAADAVPGVSGGTIAFISGIYDELVDSIKSISPAAFITLFKQGPKAFWQCINGNFLLVLFAGIVTSLLSLARLVHYSLANYPLFIWSFFFGLILASIIYVVRQQSLWHGKELLGLGAGIAGALFCAFSPTLAIDLSLYTVFATGMLAACAMILPGISGSFILLLLGVYPSLIEALINFDVVFLLVVAAGALVGLLLFSHVLSWLLHHKRAVTLSVLVGFLVGSLAIVWPWQTVLSEQVSAVNGGLIIGTRQLFTPFGYGAEFGDGFLPICIGFAVLGLGLVLGLEYLGARASAQTTTLQDEV
jgi:putative membrane protein